jgi:hypothetical protein
MSECVDCVRLREVYWAAIAECARLHELLRIADSVERVALIAESESAEQARDAARDALQNHRSKNGHA